TFEFRVERFKGNGAPKRLCRNLNRNGMPSLVIRPRSPQPKCEVFGTEFENGQVLAYHKGPSDLLVTPLSWTRHAGCCSFKKRGRKLQSWPRDCNGRCAKREPPTRLVSYRRAR